GQTSKRERRAALKTRRLSQKNPSECVHLRQTRAWLAACFFNDLRKKYNILYFLRC
uniref:Uncharacterized protein n=1 Tax=Globisporangium ultimum (strain ATCC 200006 / CBS 805.95 / DAOM BR144) TaxID=431595 RepID=K3X9M5_GLOUD